ncbi:MAG: DUF4199 domain-containing protein [Flavobacteriales bacterium]|nr:DUF4199 domain-containing protein [Flavobacteriales bacterium]
MFKESIKYGLIGGAIFILYSLITQIVGMEHFVSLWVYLLTFVFMIVWVFVSIGKQRKANGNSISFKNALISGMISFGIMTLITTVYGILYFNVIAPDAKYELTELIIESTVESMENFGAPQDSIDQFLDNDAEKMPEQFETGSQIVSYFKQLIFGLVISLIAALILKRKPENIGA